MKISETQLVGSMIQYLQLKGLFCWRNNTGALKTQRGSLVRFGVVGSPDIMIVYGGQFIGVEAKVGRNKQSKHQKEFQKKLEEAGGLYWLIYSLEELQEKIEDFI